jgi:hypothetical protein
MSETSSTISRTEASVPFSEDVNKPNRATRQELIDDLMDLVKANPTQVISRNWYRVAGSFAESAYTSIFGTFQEFKRQAGVTPSRHAALLEKNVAKHASADNYRQLNAERHAWGDAYKAPAGGRFVTDMIITDTHDIQLDPFVRRIWLDTLERVQPRRIIFGGDAFDLPEFGKYSVDPREWDVVGRIKAVHELFAETRAAAPNARIDLLEGNHEFRLLRHLGEATPAMRAILADLHGFTVPKLLGLDAFEVNYQARGDLGAFWQKDITQEVRKNYLIVDNTYLVHHFPEGQRMGLPGMHGHHHKHIVWPHYSPDRGSFEWHQLGAGHKRQASYCAGERWGNGFMLAHCDTEKRHVAFEYVDLSFGHAVVGGRWFSRASSELIE